MNLITPRAWTFLCFFISGVTGLVYEVVWTRLLTLVMGNTHYSVATVLTAFMGGLALGSYLGGRFIDGKTRPLLAYAVLEGVIGVYCFFIPHLIQWALPVLKWIYASNLDAYPQASFLRFLLCAAILLVPTALMGATLPVLGKAVSGSAESVGKDVGTLYSINTFGAVLGALSSAFVLMPRLGLQGTITLAASANLGIAAAVFLLFRGETVAPREGKTVSVGAADAISDSQKLLVLAVFGFSGASALIYQVAWNRIFSLVLGSSVYAFSLIVTTFILGLALGSAAFSRLCDVFRDRMKVFGVLQTGIGVSALVTMPLFGWIPLLNRWVYETWGVDFVTVQFSNFLIIFVFLFIPTFLMGGQFPVVIKLAAGNLSRVGRNIGVVYSANTIGTIVGSFAGGFILVPWAGIQNSILFAVFLNVTLGVLLLALTPGFSRNAKIYALPAMIVLCVIGARSVPAWDRAVISSGSYMPYRIKDLDAALKKANKILFYREGIHTTVTTELAVSGNIFLRVNGKTDASLAQDMRTQLLSGYLPMFFHEKPESALVIGMGSGITLGAVEQFPIKNVDMVEISREVVEGARYFGPFNHHAADDKRARVIYEDGRNHVALTGDKYDVIISEPSNPWISGVGTLFTREFFQLLKNRLNPGGVACIWIHTNMSPDNFKSITGTFSAVFPHVTMWESIVGDDYLLIGSGDPLKFSYETVEAFLRDPAKGKDLARIGVRNVRDMMSLMVMSRDEIVKFSGDAPTHTDNNLLLEFGAPQYIYKDERALLVRLIAPFFKVDTGIVKFSETDEAARSGILADLASVQRSESQIAEIKRRARIDVFLDAAKEAFNRGDYARAVEEYSEILKLDDEHVMTWLNLGNAYISMKRYAEAKAAYEKSVKINPYYLYGYIALAKLHLAAGQAAKAENVLREVIAWNPGDAETRVYAGLAFSLQKAHDKAKAEFEKALALDSSFAPAHYYLGVYALQDNPGQARRHLENFLRLAESRPGDENLVHNAQKILRGL